VTVDTDENLLLVRGSVPGPAGAYIFIRKSAKQKAAPQPQRAGKPEKK
jgi:ribosomal protein L3